MEPGNFLLHASDLNTRESSLKSKHPFTVFPAILVLAGIEKNVSGIEHLTTLLDPSSNRAYARRVNPPFG